MDERAIARRKEAGGEALSDASGSLAGFMAA